MILLSEKEQQREHNSPDENIIFYLTAALLFLEYLQDIHVHQISPTQPYQAERGSLELDMLLHLQISPLHPEDDNLASQQIYPSD